MVYGPIIIFEIFSGFGPLLSKIGYGPENGLKITAKIGSEPIYLIYAYLTGSKLGDFFDPLMWGHYHLIGLGGRQTNWVRIAKIEIFF